MARRTALVAPLSPTPSFPHSPGGLHGKDCFQLRILRDESGREALETSNPSTPRNPDGVEAAPLQIPFSIAVDGMLTLIFRIAHRSGMLFARANS